jgi:hypothetical protein
MGEEEESSVHTRDVGLELCRNGRSVKGQEGKGKRQDAFTKLKDGLVIAVVF